MQKGLGHQVIAFNVETSMRHQHFSIVITGLIASTLLLDVDS
ncbi:MAG: hypothetical protein ACI9QV_000662 [Methylophagaceae bacterium]|jgi:hypothetical protein